MAAAMAVWAFVPAGATCPAGTYTKPPVFTGVQLNMPIDRLGQFSVCMDAPYSDYTTSSKLAACAANPDQFVAVGTKQAGSSTLNMVAMARAGDVFLSSCTTNLANGVYWYRCPSQSFGFAAESTITLNSADTLSSNCQYRLSWHLDQVNGGYRDGCTLGLNSDNQRMKQIYIISGAWHCLLPRPFPTLGGRNNMHKQIQVWVQSSGLLCVLHDLEAFVPNCCFH
jgi:hypothetical protein